MQRQAFQRNLLAILALTAAIPAVPALAADNSTLASPLARERSADQAEAAIGVGYGNVPVMPGSDTNVNRAGVLVEANFANGLFLSSVDGIGYRFFSDPSGFSMSGSLGASTSREAVDGFHSNTMRLERMNDLDSKPQANLFLNYDQGPWHGTFAVRKALASGSSGGTSADLQGRFDAYATRDDLVQLSADVSYANRTLMQSYFGAGGLVAAPHADIATGLGVNYRHAFNQHWVGDVGANYVRLGSSAADVSERRNQTAVSASIAYRF